MPTTVLALVAVAVVVVLWLVISFTSPSPRRTALELLATTAFFLTLGSWFVGLSLEARAEGRTLLLVPFGFLAVLFCSGLVVSTWRTVAYLLGRGSGTESATH